MKLPRLIALIGASALLIASPFVSVRPSAAQSPPPPAGEQGCNVFDPAGDTFDTANGNPRADDRADITQLCVTYGYGLRVFVAVARPTDPETDPGWQRGDSLIELRFDTAGDPQPELAVQVTEDAPAVVRQPSDGSAVCLAGFYPTAQGYGIEVSRNCLGSDTVAVRALMIYDPAPNPNPGPLIADRAPDSGFVPQVTRQAPAAPAPLTGPAPACTPDERNDTIDETFAPVVFDAGDIVESCVQHSADHIRLTMRMARPTDPQSDPLWRPDTTVGWDIDVNNDNREDFTALFNDKGVRLYAPDASGPSDSCVGEAGFDGANLIARFPRPCLGNPQYLSARSVALFARLPRLEPEPPASIDLYRFPGFGPLVGAPGVTVPTQVVPTPGTTPTTAPRPLPVTEGSGSLATGGTTGGRSSSTGGGTTSGTQSSGGTTSGASTRSTSSRSTGATLAFTGLVSGLGPAVGGAGAVLSGGLMVLISRRRPRRPSEPAGRWDLLPGGD